jgi:hypothetical protein
MKTQVFKNSETVKSSDSMMVFTMIIFWGLLLFGVDNMYLFLKNEAFNSEAKYENGLQFRKTNQPKNAVGSENAATNNTGLEIEFPMAKMQEYLIAENEPEFTVADANSIVFPESETVVLTADYASGNDFFLTDLKNQAREKTKEAVEYYAFEKKLREYLIPENEHKFEAGIANSIIFPDVETVKISTANNKLGTDNFLTDLKIQASEKTKEAVEYYAFEMRVKEYLTIETEFPLQLEDWMIDEKCWCHEWREPMALSLKK